MKTINEVMTEVKNVSNKINEICADINELRNIEKSGTQLDNNKLKSTAKRYPIKDHTICKNDEYTQKIYLTLLASVVQMGNSNISVTENSMLFISRIVEGLDTDIDSESIFKNSLELNEKIIDEFTLVINKNNLHSNFAVDSLIVANLSGKCEDKVLEYLSMLFEMIKIPKEQVGELSQLAVLILERDKKGYKKFCCTELSIDLEEFFFYVFEFCDGIIANNSKIFHLEYNVQREIEEAEKYILNIDSIISRKVVFKNIYIDETKKLPLMKNYELVIIDKCNF